MPLYSCEASIREEDSAKSTSRKFARIRSFDLNTSPTTLLSPSNQLEQLTKLLRLAEQGSQRLKQSEFTLTNSHQLGIGTQSDQLE